MNQTNATMNNNGARTSRRRIQSVPDSGAGTVVTVIGGVTSTSCPATSGVYNGGRSVDSSSPLVNVTAIRADPFVNSTSLTSPLST